MRFILLLYVDPKQNPAAPGADALMEQYTAYTDALDKAGVLLEAEAIQEPATATSVRVRTGAPATVTGPAATGPEVLQGFYLLDVQTKQDALDWAAKCPAAQTGAVEVRPMLEL
jgi:hypothetical protein